MTQRHSSAEGDDMCSMLGSRFLGRVAVFHQATYIYPPLVMLMSDSAMPPEIFGEASELPVDAWAPFFIVAHALCALFVWNDSFRMGAVAAASTSLGYYALSVYAAGAPMGALAEAWSISPHMVQNFAIAVMLTMDAVNKRKAPPNDHQ